MIVHNAHRRSIAIFTVSEVSIPPRRTESKRKYEHFNNATWRIIIYMEPNKSHILTKKTTKRTRNLRKNGYADVTVEDTVKKMIPYK